METNTFWAAVIGGTITGGFTLVALHLGEIRAKRSALLKALFDQRITLEQAGDRTREQALDEYAKVARCFIDLRSCVLPMSRSRLDRLWKNYTGRAFDYLPLYIESYSDRDGATTWGTLSKQKLRRRVDAFIEDFFRTSELD